MKTQTFCLAAYNCGCCEVVHELVMLVLAAENYTSMRGNGDDKDDPPPPSHACVIPLSAYSWVAADGTTKLADVEWYNSDKRYFRVPDVAKYRNKDGRWEVTMRVDETPGMRRWMEQRDVNYLTRLAREGRLYDAEPQWESEVSEWVLNEVTERPEVVEAMATHGSSHPAARARLQQLERERQAVEQEKREEQEKRYRDKGLIACSQDGDLEAVTYLLSLSAIDVNAHDATEKTALMHAVLGQHADIIALLLRHPAIQLDGLSDEDRSALHYAASLGDVDTIKDLLAKGADPWLKDGLDKTPRDLAIASEHASAAALLRRAEQAAAQLVSGSSSTASTAAVTPPVGSDTPLSPAAVSALSLSPTPHSPAPSSPASPATPLHREFQIAYRDLKLVAEIGRGSFGIVYRGTWSSEPVAVKQLHCQHFSPDAMAEFEREAETMVKLRNPRVTTLWGVVLEPGHYSLVMELMPKGSLFDLLHNAGERLDWTTKYRIAIDIGHGLQYLHSKGVLHRDLKSLNVLLDDRLRAKLTDFGLSRVKSESSASTRQAVGTLRWMAPELFKRKATYTPASDVYSVGVIFWELATRQLPYADAVNDAIIMQWIAQGTTEEIPAETPYKTDVEACWALESAKRPDAASLVEQLKRGFSVFQSSSASGAGGSGESVTTDARATASGPSYAVNTGGGVKSRASYR